MTVTSDDIRNTFPEFGSTTDYPDPVIDFWLSVAVVMLNASRWSTALDFGTSLFVAHNLALERANFKATIRGGVPGIGVGPVQSKGVGPVNISYDTQAGIEKDAGHWNSTNYGTRFVRYAKMMGAGPMQVSCGPGVWVL